MFVGVLKAIKGVKIEVEQKKSFLADIHRVNMGLRGLGCGQYKRTTFEGFLCIFLKILAKDMGKPLVPAVPRHLGHLGHPNSSHFNLASIQSSEILFDLMAANSFRCYLLFYFRP